MTAEITEIALIICLFSMLVLMTDCATCKNSGMNPDGEPCNCYRGSKYFLLKKRKGQGGRDLKQKKHKYNAEPVTPVDGDKTKFAGRRFDSKLERDTYGLLLLEERNGEINQIEQQFTVCLSQANISYRVDFRVFDVKLNEHVFVEAKGFVTEAWLLKVKLWHVYGPGRLRVYVAGKPWPYCSKEIIPTRL